MATPQNFVAVAGAAGNLGQLIAFALRKRNAAVKAIVRPGTAPSRTQKLRDSGVIIAEVDYNNLPALKEALQGATAVVSALQGLRDVMLGTQGALLKAAVASKVQRFIPSDYALDFTKTKLGTNRNLDLRREFHVELDKSGIQWTSVLNGGFMELLLSGNLPLINDAWHRIMYFGSVDQVLDLTTMVDTAAYTAAVAADPNPTPKFLRIAGDKFSSKELAATVSKVRGREYTPMWMGSVGFLRVITKLMKFVIGGEKTKLLPPWQGLQYLENMVSGAGTLDPLDNDRYPELTWTTVEAGLKEADAQKAKKTK
ncbi:NAD(P)-binding protein [Stipitochalara longipes BDJ]|nr:NAD(P)-binding protein [Stipitochalara longipes BDJ]